MAITNAQVIHFSNETVRPMSEKLRALKVEIDALMVDWFGGISSLVPNSNAEVLQDGRTAEGIAALNGDDITGFVVVCQALQTALNTAGYADRIAKPCVRPLMVK